MQIKILSSEANMMTSWVNWGSNETWNQISDSYAIKIWYKIGVTLHPKELQWILYRHVFAHICYVIQELARTDMYLKRTLTPLLMVRKRWTRYQNAWKNVPNMMTKKIWLIYVAKIQYARKRARMRVCEIFYKMLRMALNVCKIILRRFWAF